MAKKPNTLLRVAVPLAILGGGLALAIAIAVRPPTTSKPTTQGAQSSAPSTTPDASTPSETPGVDAPTPVEPRETADTTPSTPQAIEGLHARPVEGQGDLRPLGSLEEVDRTELYVVFSPFGAGVETLKLTHDYKTVEKKEHVELQRAVTGREGAAIPFGLAKVTINGSDVPLGGAVWRQDASDPGLFTAEIEDADGNLVARITRHFVLVPGSFNLRIDQHLDNLTDAPMTVVWTQTGPIDLEKPRSTYGGDKRRIRYGYFFPPEKQGASATVTADSRLTSRMGIFGPRDKASGKYALDDAVWPNRWSEQDDLHLVWVGLTDRYFAVVAHTPVDPASPPTTADAKLFTNAQTVKRLMLNRSSQIKDQEFPPTIVLQLTSAPQTAPAGGACDASIGVYAGPMDPRQLDADPIASSLGINDIVVYNFGSLCAACTFGWLTHVLLFILRTLHMLTQDWALAIILLVVVVRTCLHPITRWSQIRMQRFGAQMQSMGPKIKKIKEKYADDPKRAQQEQAKLWKEEGISPAGMLGCLPMFLQSPVWIALYATLFFVYDLRHQPAFYGVFQKISGGHWHFLADLASPDAAIPIPASWHFSFWIWGTVTSINILPFILAGVFFVHQKYLTPPTSATMTPEQEQQQKIMRVMMVVMFPLFMYAAPSGLALYFCTNSSLAIVENKWIRAHMKKHDLLNVDKIKADKAQKKQSGFLARLMQMAEQQRAARTGRPADYGTGRAGRNMYRRQSKKNTPTRRYKKRDK
ncbi:MAG: YidC/Oxa1 family insertase periplasmic-domain containing protein [Phycisphaerales bacterium]